MRDIKASWTYLWLLLPSLLLVVFWAFLNVANSDTGFFAALILFYLFNFTSIIAFVKIRLFNTWWLPISFLFSSAFVLIYIYIRGLAVSDNRFVMYAFVYASLFYIMPFFATSIIIAATLSIISYIKRRSHEPTR